jgi:aryl-alcohol dehydrogenase-like predicted oxidoreductase
LLFEQAKKRKVAILARVPLASGLLTGKMKADTKFEVDDHRQFNRHGEEFDRGETFSGVDYLTGLKAVEELRAFVHPGSTLSQFALRWILMFDAVTCAIPGAKNPAQAEQNVHASEQPEISVVAMQGIKKIYDNRIREAVQYYW